MMLLNAEWFNVIPFDCSCCVVDSGCLEISSFYPGSGFGIVHQNIRVEGDATVAKRPSA